MTDFQTGRSSGVFVAGSKVEDLVETYDREARNFEAMKTAFAMAGKTLETYRDTMLAEFAQSKVPIKEAEYGKTYVNRCIDLIRRLFDDTEAKRLQAVGGTEAIRQAVASIKRLYDEERSKQELQEEYEKDPTKTQHERPPGAHPGAPLVEYKQGGPRASKKRIGKKQHAQNT